MQQQAAWVLAAYRIPHFPADRRVVPIKGDALILKAEIPLNDEAAFLCSKSSFLTVSSRARRPLTANLPPHTICPRLNGLPVSFVSPPRLFPWYAALENQTQKPPQVLLVEPALEQLVATQVRHHLSNLAVHHALLVHAVRLLWRHANTKRPHGFCLQNRRITVNKVACGTQPRAHVDRAAHYDCGVVGQGRGLHFLDGQTLDRRDENFETLGDPLGDPFGDLAGRALCCGIGD